MIIQRYKTPPICSWQNKLTLVHQRMQQREQWSPETQWGDSSQITETNWIIRCDNVRKLKAFLRTAVSSSFNKCPRTETRVLVLRADGCLFSLLLDREVKMKMLLVFGILLNGKISWCTSSSSSDRLLGFLTQKEDFRSKQEQSLEMFVFIGVNKQKQNNNTFYMDSQQ